MIKNLIPIGLLYSAGITVANAAAIYPDQLKNTSGQCESNYRALNKSEAERYNDVIINKMGKWQVTALADNWVILGRGHQGEIKPGTASNTWCYPIEVNAEIPTLEALFITPGTSYQIEDELMNNKEDFIKPLSYLAHYMGFAWIGGNGSKYVGEDMVSELHDDHKYEIKGSNYGSCSGDRCDEKSIITVSNIEYMMDVDSFAPLPESVESEKELIDTVTGTGENHTSRPQIMTIFLEYNTATTWSQSSDTSISTSVTLEKTWKSPSITGGADFSVSVTAGAGKTWGKSNGETHTNRVRLGYETTVPAYTSVDASVKVYKASVSYPYEFYANISYDLSINGFMRWGGNASLNHPKDRPNETANFAIGRFAGDDKSIKHQWEHRNIPGVNKKWDWSWMIEKNGLSTIQYPLSAILRPLKTKINGTFYAEKQYASNVIWSNERSLGGSRSLELVSKTSNRKKRSTTGTNTKDNLLATSDTIKQQLEDAGFEGVKVSVTMTPLEIEDQE
jgi:hypothetical protein